MYILWCIYFLASTGCICCCIKLTDAFDHFPKLTWAKKLHYKFNILYWNYYLLFYWDFWSKFFFRHDFYNKMFSLSYCCLFCQYCILIFIWLEFFFHTCFISIFILTYWNTFIIEINTSISSSKYSFSYKTYEIIATFFILLTIDFDCFQCK